MAISDFENLLAWLQARDLLEDLAIDLSSAPLKQNFRLSAQISDSADSTMANIAEGFERGRLTEFRQFLSIAKGSCGELRSHLHTARILGYITEERFDQLVDKSRRVGRIIGGLRSAVDRKCRNA
jgi:four helix bundle protein